MHLDVHQTNGAQISVDLREQNMTRETPVTKSKMRLVRMAGTALIGTGSTLLLWIILVMLLERHASRSDFWTDALWAGTLWLSALLCTGVVAFSRHAVHPVLSCTLVFGVFGLAYMLFEGPFFGDVSKGGDSSKTQFVVWNLICLPVGVFVSAEFGSWLGRRHRSLTQGRQIAGDGA